MRSPNFKATVLSYSLKLSLCKPKNVAAVFF